MDTLSCYDLILLRRFEEAAARGLQEYNENNTNLPSLFNKMLALLNLQMYHEAYDDCMHLIRQRGHKSSSDFVFAGVALWGMNKRDESVRIWMEGLDAKYTDSAGGIEIPALLFSASIISKDDRLRRTAEGILQRLTDGKKLSSFPGPIAGYLLNEMNLEEVKQCLSTQPILRRREICQAYFYMAIKCLESSKIEYYHYYLKKCSSLERVYLEHEYYLSIALLSTLEE